MNNNSIEKNEKKRSGRRIAMYIFFAAMGTIFLFLFLLFFFPIFRGVLNIGNITGMIFSCVMIFVTWGNPLVVKLIEFLKKCIVGKIIVYSVPIMFLIGIIYVVFLTHLIVSADMTAPEKDCTVIVLGCQVRGERPSLMLMERIESAYDFLCENPEVPCIVTGGKGDDENISEAQCMYDNLVKMGIDVEVTSSDHNVDIDTVLIWEKNQEREVKFEKPEEENGDMEGEPV